MMHNFLLQKRVCVFPVHTSAVDSTGRPCPARGDSRAMRPSSPGTTARSAMVCDAHTQSFVAVTVAVVMCDIYQLLVAVR